MAPKRRIAEELVVLKQALGPRSERDLIVESIMTAIPAGRWAWLDVGIGDAVSTSKMLADLNSHGLQFDLVGVDPELQDGTVCPEAMEVELVRERIENYSPSRKFNVVNVRQSAYYFDNLDKNIENLFRMLCCPSLMLITYWTDDCFLFKLYSTIAEELGVKPKPLSISSLQGSLTRLGKAASIEYTIVSDTIDVAKILSNEGLFKATVAIAGRGLKTHLLGDEALKRLQALIATASPEVAIRSNALVVVRSAM